MSIALLVVALAYVGVCVYDRRQKKIAYSVHVQGKTEQDEVMDLTVILFEGETEGKWKERLNQAFLLKEWRLKYNGDRMLALQKDYQEKLESKKLEIVQKEK